MADWYAESGGARDRAFDAAVKSAVRGSPFFAKMFKHFGADPADLRWVRFRLADLGDTLAGTEGDTVLLNRSLAAQPVESVLRHVAHELSHWLTRRREEEHYFSDPEEVAGFEWAMACELSRGASADEVEASFLPQIEAHAGGPVEGRKLFLRMLLRAKRLA